MSEIHRCDNRKCNKPLEDHQGHYVIEISKMQYDRSIGTMAIDAQTKIDLCTDCARKFIKTLSYVGGE